MLSSTYAASVWLCCLAAVLVTLTPAHASNSLKFVTIARVRGCPLTVYFHDASRTFYLGPAFCITRDTSSMLTGATLRKDNFIGGSYLNFPVLVSNSLLLEEARRSLTPLLQNRSLEFLQVLSARTSERWGIPMVLWEPGQISGHLRLPCPPSECYRIMLQITNGQWLPIERIRLATTVRIPGSQLIELQQTISLAYRSRTVLKQSSRNILYGDRCSNLRLYDSIKLNDSCHATVLRSSYRRGHFVVEPVLCYEGRHSANQDVVTLTLETKTEQVRNFLRRRLPSALQIDFLDVVSVEVSASDLLQSSNISFEPLRLDADGNSAELLVVCESAAARDRLVSVLRNSPTDFLRHVSLRFDSQLRVGDNSCTWQSQSLPLSVTEVTEVTEVTSELSQPTDYHPINGLLCIRPAFKRVLVRMSDSLCAIMCSATSNCQAFSTVSGSCELFVFDKCSLNVRDCGCTRRGRVFVRRREGLEPGQLCPSGFGHDLCGVKYNVTRDCMVWPTARRRSEQQPGLVIMVDVMDKAELRHVVSVFSSEFSILWLGGAQLPGSAEPAGGWFWVSCNRPVNMSSEAELWGSGEPNNDSGSRAESVLCTSSSPPKMNDYAPDGGVFPTMSECVSPF